MVVFDDCGASETLGMADSTKKKKSLADAEMHLPHCSTPPEPERERERSNNPKLKSAKLNRL